MSGCENCTAPIKGAGFRCSLCEKRVCRVCRDARSCCNDVGKPKSTGFLDAPMGGYADDTTSKAAAEAAHMGGKAEEKHRRIFRYLQALGDEGSTDWEGFNALDLHRNTYGPHRYELVRQGLVKDSGRTRPTDTGSPAHVFVACSAEFRPVETKHRLSKAKILEIRVAELEGTVAEQARIIAALRNEIAELKDPFDRTTGQGGLF